MELQRTARVRILGILTLATLIIAPLFGVVSAPSVSAAQTVPYKVNFQGRLTDNNGNILSDGSYNIKFRLFDAATAGTNKWEEDRVFGTVDNRIIVQNGLFNVQFGDLTALSPALFSGVFPLYLEVELPTPATATCATNGCAAFTEGAMTPRQPLASSPYALNSQTLDGIDATGFVQLTPVAQQTGSINVSGNVVSAASMQGATATFSGASALTLGSTTNAGAIILNDGTVNARAVTLNTAGLAASYSLTLPTSVPTTSKCLSTDATTASQLVFSACGATTLQLAYNGGSTVTLGANGALTVLDAATALTGDLLVVKNNAGTASYFGVSAAGLKVYDGSNNANYASLTSSGGKAILQSSSGLLQLGQGSGNVNIALTGTTDTFRFNKTNTPTAAVTSDEFVVNRSDTGGSIALGGSLLKVEDLSSGTAAAPTLLLLNQSNTGATGYLFRAQMSGINKLTVDPSGNLFVAGSLAFGNGGNANNVSLLAPSGAAAYSLKLPSAAGTTSQCLQTTSTDATQLIFSACGSSTLQNTYDNSLSPAQILLADAKDLKFTAPDTTTDPNVLVNLQCATCSANGGRFAVQNNGSDTFTVANNTATSTAFLFKPATDSTTAFQVQQTNATPLLTADTVNTVIKIGTTSSATLANVKLLVTLAEVSSTLRVGDATNGFEVSTTGPLYRGTARPTRRIAQSPEFIGAVIRGSGTANTGTMSTGYDATNYHNYYRWTTTQATSQTYDIVVRVPVPLDYSALPLSPQICFTTYSSNLTSSTFTLEMRDTANALVTLGATSFTPTTASTWGETCQTISGVPTLTPGGFMTLRMTMSALSSSEARLGEFRLDYLTKF